MDLVGFPTETKPGEIPEVSLRGFSKFYEVQTFNVSSVVSREQQRQLNDAFGVDLSSQMISVLNNEDLMNAERKLKEKYDQLGTLSYDEVTMTKWKRRVSKIFKKLKFPVYVEQEHLFRKILLYAQMIGVRSRMGAGNFVVVNSRLGTLLSDSPGFEPSPVGMNLNSHGIVNIGTISRLSVFVDSSMRWTDDRVIVGRTTKQNQTGVHLVMMDREYIEMADPIDYGKIKTGIISRRCTIDTVNAEKNFFAFDVILRKAPWWRKLFKL